MRIVKQQWNASHWPIILGLVLLKSTLWAQVPLMSMLKVQPPGLPQRPSFMGVAASSQTRAKQLTTGNVKVGKEPWIVYSDRDNNPTYRRANAVVRFKQMQFREAFYVLKEREGFLKLIKYDPALKVGTFYAPRLLKDRKSARFYGWAPKSQFLLTSQSPSDSVGAKPILFCPALTSGRVLLNTSQFLSHDSLRLFSRPDLTTPLQKRLRLYDLVYIFKLSETGEQALLGATDWFPPDSAINTLLGWAPTAAMQPVGQGLFLEADTLHAPASTYEFYNSPTAALQNKPDSLADRDQFSTVSWAGMGVRFPVLKACTTLVDQTIWQLGALTPLFRTENSVLNVNGQRLSQRQFTNWRSHATNYNLVYVVEDSPVLSPFWGELVNTMQATTIRIQDSLQPTSFRVGAVLYHARPRSGNENLQANLASIALSRDLTRAVDFVNRRRPPDNSTIGIENQPIRSGLQQAFSFLDNYPGENNIVILVGVNGDSRDISQLNAIQTGMRTSEARLISFQVTAPADTVASNFVLQSEQLVIQSAEESAKPKRERLVSPDLVINTPVYDLKLGDQNIYRLDFPRQSMVPGWVLFPRKNQTLPFSLLQAVTDSLLAQLRFDTKRTVNALDRAFAAMAPLRSRVNSQVNRTLLARREPTLAGINPALFLYRDYPFYRQTYAKLSDSSKAFHQLRLITPDAYNELGQWFDLLAADGLDPFRLSDRIELASRFRQLSRRTGQNLPDSTTLGQALKQLTGLPVRHPLPHQLRLADLIDPDRLPEGLWMRILYLIRERRDFYHRVPTFANSQFTSNGRQYYWLSEDLFR